MSSSCTILIPMFNASEEIVACIESILSSDAKGRPIIVGDDGSQGEHAEAVRQAFGDCPSVQIVTNVRNRGYTFNIQNLIDLSDADYICILNSDTVTPSRWLTPLMDTLIENASVSAAGPLSNAASYQSLPILHGPNGFAVNAEFGATKERREKIVDNLRAVFSNSTIDVPVLNGFCTLFDRQALVCAGGFDAVNFPDGYGEENDVAIRMRARGERLAVCPTSFVYHHKSKSFGPTRRDQLSVQGSDRLRKLYGKDLLSETSDQLERNGELNLIRRICGSWIAEETLLSIRLVEHSTGQLNAKLSPPSIHKFAGPIVLSITPEVTSWRSGFDGNHLTYQISDCELRVWVPDGEHIFVSSTYPVESLLSYLAFRSHYQAVSVRPKTVGAESPYRPLADELSWKFHYLDAHHDSVFRITVS